MVCGQCGCRNGMAGKGRSIEGFIAVDRGICARLNGLDQRHFLRPGSEPRQPGGDDGLADARVRAGHQYDATHTRSGTEAWHEAWLEEAQYVVDVLFVMGRHHVEPDARSPIRYRRRPYRSSEHTGLTKVRIES